MFDWRLFILLVAAGIPGILVAIPGSLRII
jgi:hypothetical protein